jgi:pimeloyl-[acyl-carrier protein] methyl ester esterase
MKDLLLIPGWGFDARVWQPLADLLKLDFRLHYAIEDTPDGAIICGWSLGALSAMQLALAQPERISSLVLIGATPRFVQAPDWPQAQPLAVLQAFAAAVAADAQAALRRFVALLNQGDAQARRLTRELSAMLDLVPSLEVLAAGLATLRDTDLRAQVGKICQPVLLLHGAQDSLMPIAAVEWLAQQLPHARLEIFPGTAHAPLLADPQRCAKLLMGFAYE